MAVPTMSPEEMLKRRKNVDSAMGSTAAEGEAAGPEARALFERYAVGELDLREVGIELDKLHNKVRGRVRAA